MGAGLEWRMARVFEILLKEWVEFDINAQPGPASQMPLMDLKNFQFSLEDRDRSKINLVDLRST